MKPLPSDIRAFLRDREIRPRKSLGQNFLIDPNFLDAMVRDLELTPLDTVIEIGVGLGHLTERLISQAGKVWAFEIDPALFEIAKDRFADEPHLELFLLDGARFQEKVTFPEKGELHFISNLPYSDYSRIMISMLSVPFPVKSYTLMIQRDVYDRLKAKPGSKEYGPWSVLVQAMCSIRLLRKAGGRLFYPPPRVDSAVFQLERSGAIPPGEVPSLLRDLKSIFSHRRKIWREGKRPEEFSPQELISLLRAPEG